MTKTLPLAALAAALTLASATASHANLAGIFGQRGSVKIEKPAADYNGQWWVSNGCSYSRAHAPGYAPSYYLILNPHHLGQPNAKPGCPVKFTLGQ